MSGINSDSEFEKLITGTITASAQTVEFESNDAELYAVAISGTWVGTLLFETTVDGTNWIVNTTLNLATQAKVTSTSVNGTFFLLTAGFAKGRVRCSAYTSGTANINALGSDITSIVYALQADSWDIRNVTGTVSLPTGASTETTLSAVNTKITQDFGTSTTAIRVAAQLGNATGSAAFGAGVTSAQTLRVVLPTDQSMIPVGGKNVSGTNQSFLVDRYGSLRTNIGADRSVFGPLVVGSRVQQIGVDFSQTITNNNLIQTVSGTGAISLANANASITTGTGTTASAQLQTVASIVYAPGREIYVQFSAAFTTPTSAASQQSAGLYNGTDGLLIGYNGLNFGISTVAGGVSTFVSSSSFNLDTLTGGVNSQFTRAGSPEAVNFAYKNVYRIRAGWLGAAPIYYEILSPDGNWVTFHVVRQPNLSINPAFLQPSLPITMLVSKTSSDATNLKITTTSWDGGVVDTSGETDVNGSGTVSALNGSTLINAQSRSTIVADITGTWSGTLQVQGDVGNGTWNAIYAIDTNAISFQNITSNKTIIVGCAGYNSIRLIATAWTSGTANVNWTASQGTQAILSQAVGNIASGQADTGNPIKVGGVYNSTLPVVSNGQRVDLQLDQNGRLLTSTAVTSSLPAATFSSQRVITNGSTYYTSFTASVKLALKQFYAGGTGIGRQTLYSYAPTNTLFLNSGDFETAGDITNWPYFSNGGAGTGSVALSATQAFTGTRSAAVTFTTSDANHSNGLKQTFATALDISGWRYITAEFFNTLSAGGTYTRTISIVITDSNGNTRKFDVSGTSITAPFNASNWIKITGEIANPTSATGTNFDVTSVASVELRMTDSASRAGTIYWDTARLEAQITPLFPIYHYQNTSFNIAIDPVFIMNIGDQILIAQTNNDTSKQEYFALAGGVLI